MLLDNVEILPLNIFLLVQKKIMLMDRFKRCTALKKVLLMGIFMSNMLFVYMINLLVQMLQAIQKQTSLTEANENEA